MTNSPTIRSRRRSTSSAPATWTSSSTAAIRGRSRRVSRLRLGAKPQAATLLQLPHRPVAAYFFEVLHQKFHELIRAQRGAVADDDELAPRPGERHVKPARVAEKAHLALWVRANQ